MGCSLRTCVVGFASLAAVTLARPAGAQCAVGFTPVFYAATFSCYRLTTVDVDWVAAQSNAVSLGGYLAAIGSAAENAAARSYVNGALAQMSVWIGLTDEAVEGTFVWVNGEPVVFTNWSAGEPNNFGNEDYTEMVSNGQWNDLASSSRRFGLVEQVLVSAVPEPATLLLVFGGLLGLGAVRSRRRS